MGYQELTYMVPIGGGLPNQAWRAGNPDAGRRLVVFPGAPARKYLFERFLRAAPDDLDVILIARPGYGRGHKRAYTDFNDQVAAAGPFLDEKPTVTLGVSYGGELALKAALDYPAIVCGVVTVAALIREPRGYVQPFVDLGGAPLIRSVLPRTLHHARAEVAGRRAQIGPLLARLTDFDRPVTIVHGDADHLVSRADAEALKSCFGPAADVQAKTIRGGSHFLEAQMPRTLFDIVDDVFTRAKTFVTPPTHKQQEAIRHG